VERSSSPRIAIASLGALASRGPTTDSEKPAALDSFVASFGGINSFLKKKGQSKFFIKSLFKKGVVP